MTSITLTPEQIRGAPPEVRRWIEHEIATSLGLEVRATGSQRNTPELAGCSHDELAAVLALIQGAFPVVNVFFELGRNGMRFGQDRLEAHRLSNIQHHTRLQSAEQVVACLNLIDEALRRVRGSADASFYGLDGDYCFVATVTQRNIRRLWFELIGRNETDVASPGPGLPDGPEIESPAPPGGMKSASSAAGIPSVGI